MANAWYQTLLVAVLAWGLATWRIRYEYHVENPSLTRYWCVGWLQKERE